MRKRTKKKKTQPTEKDIELMCPDVELMYQNMRESFVAIAPAAKAIDSLLKPYGAGEIALLLACLSQDLDAQFPGLMSIATELTCELSRQADKAGIPRGKRVDHELRN